MNNLDAIAELLLADFDRLNGLRESAIAQARTLTRQCAKAIRAVHRREWDSAESQLQAVRQTVTDLQASLVNSPEIYHAGYTQDALKEYVEAFLVYHLVRQDHLLLPEQLGVSSSTYANGLVEAASELRRYILDNIRHSHYDESERLLDTMERIYAFLMSLNYPDAVTGGIRHRVDALRGVLERTRGDLTISQQQNRLASAMISLQARLESST
jgi:translin